MSAGEQAIDLDAIRALIDAVADWNPTLVRKYPEKAHKYMVALSAALVEHDLRTKAEGWNEACEALAWCFDNGPERDALPYLIEHNPFAASIENGENN